MSKGCMAKVAEVLGVEIGEVFKISKEDSNEKFTKYFRITHDNIEESEYQSYWNTCNSEVLLRLLNGSLTLCKLSWKPLLYQTYFTPCINRCDKFYNYWEWRDTTADIDRYEHGLVCKTKEEATKLSREIRNKVKEARYCG